MPKVNFNIMPLDDNVEIVKWILQDDFDKEPLFGWFPKLKEIDVNDDEKISEIVKDVYNQNYNNIKDSIDSYKKVWEKYEKEYFDKLEKYLNIKWPKEINDICVYVGIITVFPRCLDTYSFDLCVNLDNNILIDSIAHECLHFLWFKKWVQLFPNSSRDTFEFPNIVWRYSEMVVDPILNSNSMKELLNMDVHAYDEFYKIKVNDKYLMDELKNIYEENISIEEKIIKGFDFIKDLEIF